MYNLFLAAFLVSLITAFGCATLAYLFPQNK